MTEAAQVYAEIYQATANWPPVRRQAVELNSTRIYSLYNSGNLEQGIAAFDVDPATCQVVEMPAERRAGFLAIRSRRAADLARALRQHAVFADSRGDMLRLGPAPYVSDEQLQEAAAKLSRIVTAL